MNTIPTQYYYKAMDIYNYRTGVWTNGTLLPEELFPTETFRVPLTSTVVRDALYVWYLNTFAVYNTSKQQWTRVVNMSDLSVDTVDLDRKIFSPEPVINDVAYLYNSGNHFYKVASEDGNWPMTAAADEATQFSFVQRVAFDGKIFALRYYNELQQYTSVYNYDPAADRWDLTYLPYPVPYASMGIGGDFLVVLTLNSSIFYLFVPTGQWVTMDFSYDYLPAASATTNSSLFIAGGSDPATQLYTAIVLIFDTSTFVLPPATPNQTDDVPSIQSSPVEGPILVAIVVPIVVVVAAGLIVLIILLHRRYKKRKNTMSVVGLEARYGQWFTPFNDIQFGDQLGQGANGQVFKGRWNNTAESEHDASKLEHHFRAVTHDQHATSSEHCATPWLQRASRDQQHHFDSRVLQRSIVE